MRAGRESAHGQAADSPVATERDRIDEGVKGVFFPGMVPPLSGYAIVANDNYAPVAQAA